MKFIAGNSNTKLAQEIASSIGEELSETNITRFADGEICVELIDELAFEDCIVIQSISKSKTGSMNDNLMELMFIMDALHRIPVNSVTTIIPYLGYARQDRRVFPQSPVSAKVVADMLSSMSDYVITADIHAEQELGFFTSPIKNVYGLPILLEDIKSTTKNLKNISIVSPDFGALKKARNAADMLGVPYAVVDKQRPKAGVSKVMNIVGEYKDKDCILLDDMIDSAGTLCNAAESLMEKGAKSVKAYATHGVFSGAAFDRITKSPFAEVVVTNTIEQNQEKLSECPKIRTVSAARIFANAIGEM